MSNAFNLRTGAALLLLGSLLCACNSDAAGTGDDDEEVELEEPELGYSASALTQNRSVLVDFSFSSADGSFVAPSAISTTKDGRERVPVAELARMFQAVCADEYRAAFPSRYNRATADTWWFDNPTNQCEIPGDMRGEIGTAGALVISTGSSTLRFSSAFGYFDRQFVQLCMAHQALRAAAAYQPTYFVARMGKAYYWADSPTDIPDEIAARAAARGVTLTGAPEFSVQFPAQSASEQASLHLFAAEQFRKAALLGTLLLRECPTTFLSGVVSASNGDEFTFAELAASRLSESLMAMQEAAEQAQKHIAAAAQAKLSTAVDPQVARARAWRDPGDSRLEGASIYLSVPTRLFNGSGLMPLYLVHEPGRDDYSAHANPIYARSTWKVKGVLGYIRTPREVPSSSTIELNEYGVNSTSDFTVATTPPPLGYAALQGYVPRAPGTGITMVRDTQKVDAQSVVIERGVWREDQLTTLPAGRTANATGFLIYKDPTVFDGEYPVVTTLLNSQARTRAAELIRGTRVSPCLQGFPAPCPIVAGDATRSVATLRAEIFAAAGVKPDASASFQDIVGIDDDSLAAAARRVVEEMRVLGRGALVETVAGKPARVYGTQRGRADVHPSYLFALTEGAAPINEPGTTTFPTLYSRHMLDGPKNQYAVRGVYHAVDFFRYNVPKVLATREQSFGPKVAATLRSAEAWASNLSDGRAATQVIWTGTSVSYLAVALQTRLNTQAEVVARYDAWAGEAGLECALTGRVGGKVCDPAAYKFNESNWRAMNAPTPPSAGAGTTYTPTTGAGIPDFRIDLSAPKPSVVTGVTCSLATGCLPPGLRVYLTEETAQGRRVLLALTVPSSDMTGLNGRLVPLMTKAMEDSLLKTLAADVNDPEDPNASCAGVPRDQKVVLEDELIPVNLDDPYDSSFEYYLKEAEDTARRADDLGQELVEQGLQMDLRAEQAAQRLEELCGGVINVGRLGALACDKANCDLVKLLQTATDADYDSVGAAKSEVEGVRQCLGVASPKPVPVAIGDQDLCMWKYKPCTTGGAGTACGTRTNEPAYPPLVCPTNSNGVAISPTCQGLPRQPVLRPTSRGASDTRMGSADCTCAFTGITKTFEQATEGEFGAVSIEDHIGLTATDANGEGMCALPAPSGSDPSAKTYACSDLMTLRKRLNNVATGGGATTRMRTTTVGGVTLPLPANLLGSLVDIWRAERLGSWVNQEDLYPVASAIGLTQDLYGYSTVTLNGRPWLTLGNMSQGPVSARRTGWACTGQADLFRPASGATCTTSDNCASPSASCEAGRCVDLRTMWDPNAATSCYQPSDWGTYFYMNFAGLQPLSCGGVCSWNSPQLASLNGMRLAGAVTALKLISGASFDNVFLAQGVRGGVRMMVDQDGLSVPNENLVVGSTLPSFHPTHPGKPYAIDTATNELCALVDNDGSGQCTRIRAAQEADLPVPAWTVWSPIKCPNKDWEGCGDMNALLAGNRTNVRFNDGRCKPKRVCVGTLGIPAISLFGNNLGGGKKCFAMETPSGNPSTAPNCFNLPQDVAKLDRFVYDTKCQGLSSMIEDYQSCKGNTLNYTNVLDGLELACIARQQDVGGCDTLLREEFAIQSIGDFSKVRAKMMCAADRVEATLERMFVADVPADILPALQSGNVSGTYPTHRGQYGQTVAQLSGALQRMVGHKDTVVQQIRDLGNAFEKARTDLTILGLEQSQATIDAAITDLEAKITANQGNIKDLQLQIDNLRMEQSIESLASQCALAEAAALPQVSVEMGLPPSASVSASLSAQGAADAQCANQLTQTGLEHQVQGYRDALHSTDRRILEKQQQIHDLVIQKIKLGQSISQQEKREVLLSLSSEITKKADELHRSLIGMAEVYATLHRSMAALDSQRNEARRQAANVLMLTSDGMGRQFNVNAVMRAQRNTLRARYEDERDRAIRAAYIARRAIEQKLGVDLSEMDRDVAWVEAPKKWADTVCTLSGIDYDTIRDAGMQTAEGAPRDYNYADGFVGDYVAKLREFLEAYRHGYPFTSGSDIVVASLRDDLIGAVSECSMQGPNWLFYSQNPAVFEPERFPDSAGWVPSCKNGKCLLAAPESSSDQQPFTCSPLAAGVPGETGARCRALGGVMAARLEYTPTTQVVGSAEGLAYRIAGDGCPSGGLASSCLDLSGNGATISSYPGSLPAVTTAENGIGGRPALLSTHVGKGMWIDTSTPIADEYTVTFVTSLTGAAPNAPWWAYRLWESKTAVPGQRGTTNLYLRSVGGSMRLGVLHYLWNLDANGADLPGGPHVVGDVSAPLSGATGPWVVSLRASSVTGLTELWVNGQRVGSASGPLRVHPSSLDAAWALFVSADETTGDLRAADIQAHTRALSELEISRLHQSLGSTYGVPVVGGDSAAGGPGSDEPDLWIRQVVPAEPGGYWFSWYEKATCAAATLEPVMIRDGVEITPDAMGCVSDSKVERWLSPGWVRRYAQYTLTQSGEIEVGLEPLAAVTTTGVVARFAGPQLERLSGTLSVAPSPYFPTDSDLEGDVGQCEDQRSFALQRSQYWTTGFEYVCPAGAGDDCTDFADVATLPRRAYREWRFSLSADDIERGDFVKYAGFAKGNFNYRFDTVGVNVVGSNVIDCTASDLPSACEGGGFLQYSLRHDGPFAVRNYDGETYEAPLYSGRIQSAKALATETYLTNPLQSADRGALGQYTRTEFRGRPLEGNFGLRIYDTPGLDWSAIEDVQLVVNYRYWTRSRGDSN